MNLLIVFLKFMSCLWAQYESWQEVVDSVQYLEFIEYERVIIVLTMSG